MEITVFKVFVDVQGHIGVVLLVRLMEILILECFSSKQMKPMFCLLFRCCCCPSYLGVLGAFMQHAIRQVRYKILGCLAGRVASNFVLHIVHTCLRRDSTPA